MMILTTARRSVAAAILLTAGAVTGMGSAAAQPDYGAIPVDPNAVTDSTAFIAAESVMNPNGQPGVETVYTHRDGTRQITATVLVLPDPAAATASMDDARARLASKILDSTTQPAAVGAGGMIVSGLSADRSQSVTTLTFTEGNAFADIAFDGPPKDPVPADLVTEYGQRQDAAIKAALAA